jgi:2-keto-3-deoxy-L-rhamnonate aldolase RhmA
MGNGSRKGERMGSMKRRLKAGELLLGTMISEVRNPNVAHLLARAGFEFLIVDNEHGTYSSETVSAIVAAARGAGVEIIVRIPEIRREAILKPLDSGAAGLLVPQVDTVEQAREVVRHAKYPPEGRRGAALRRAHSRYDHVDAAEYLARANEETLIAVQAETPEAIDNAEAIAAVAGIDCVFVGPFDLSVALEIPGQLQHPRQVAAIEAVVQACRKQGKAAGILMFEAAALADWIARGMRFVAYSSDVSLLADAAAAAVRELKSVAPETPQRAKA